LGSPVRSGEPLMPQSSADQLQSIPMSPSLGQSLGKAKDFAREQAHRAITLEHLLLALIEDADATGVLKACNIDIDRLGTDVSGYLGGLLEDMRAAPGTEPGPDPELLRVVEAARQAATQSRRRTIDGAIVLAAIVGDAKSPAAGLLKAHGMTFEEAIKTLQKASAQARSKQFSGSSQRAPGEPPANEAPEKAAAAPAPAPAPASAPTPAAAKATATSAATEPPPGQMADEFLAAARARIQQRNASAAPAKAEPQSPAESQAKSPAAPSLDEPKDPPPAGTAKKDGAAADASPAVNGAAGQPDPGAGPAVPPAGSPAPATPGTPQGPPESRSEQRSPAAPQGGAQKGLPGGFQLGAEGAARLAPVPPGSTGAPPMPRMPDRMARGERADGSGPPLKRPPGANGALTGQRRPSGEAPRQSGRSSASSTRGQRAAAGPLMEAIPRRMRVGRAASAQVRIGRDKVDSLMQLLTGSRMQRPEGVAARVLSVRLRAPEGGFAIEPGTPETQWIEATPGQPQDDPVAWYWTITPLWRGRWPLLLQVSARAIGRDGIAAEQAPPERVIEVSVRPNLLRRLWRWMTGVVLLTFGAAVGWLSQDKLAEDFVDVVTILVKNILGLLRTSGFLP
jgi:neural Wiskott-Aldrich syndrome protein